MRVSRTLDDHENAGRAKRPLCLRLTQEVQALLPGEDSCEDGMTHRVRDCGRRRLQTTSPMLGVVALDSSLYVVGDAVDTSARRAELHESENAPLVFYSRS